MVCNGNLICFLAVCVGIISTKNSVTGQRHYEELRVKIAHTMLSSSWAWYVFVLLL